jgi:ectoine hydroxylase-related dioxygenase (phytanoyl-CoA dioxygenase family)
MLNNKQQQDFEQQGYLVLSELFSHQQVNTLKAAALKIVDAFDPQSTRSVFSTETDSNTNRDDYFLDSDNKIRCFFEEDAFSSSGELQQAKALSINKIGHALHVLSPEFAAFSQSSIIAQIAEDLGVVAPEIRQSMYIFKQPKIGGVIRWHQDATYFFTSPQSVVTFWFAIEDANLQNGCLQVDKQGADFVLKEQFKRYKDDTTELVSLENVDWPTQDRALPLEVKAGSLVVFNGALPHFSEANLSNKSRHAFTLHITSAESQYDVHNWLRAKGVKIHS